MAHNSTILIVDDTPSARNILKGVLAEQGYNLAFASGGEEALAQAARLTPDLILLDVMMPDMDGFEVCRRLRADPFLAEVPVVMVTALDDHTFLLEGIKAGADDFISKPFNHAELRARVKTITRLNRYRRLLSERTKFDWVVAHTDDGYLVVADNDQIRYANTQARLYLNLPSAEDEVITESFLALAQKRYHLRPEVAWATWPKIPDDEWPGYLVQPATPTINAFWLQVDILDVPTGPDKERVVRLRNVTQRVSLQHDMYGFQEMIQHKLGTPFMVIMLNLDLLSQHAQTMPRAEIAEFADSALKSARRFYGQVEDIMQYMKVSNLAHAQHHFDFSQLQPRLEEIKTGLALETVTVHIQKEASQTTIPLPDKAVELLLWEILENAKKFHPHQSPVVEVRVTLLNAERLCLQISDDGLTLSPEQLGRVWQPYYQAEKHFTGEMPGMGLGLSMVASLVWSVGGTCHITNKETEPGIIINLTFPLNKKEVASDA